MLGRTRIHTRARGSGAGAGAGLSDLQRILALSPSLVVWPALATMTVATDGTGAAPAPGQVVGRILDLSGNGNNLIAGTWASPSDAARATYQNGAISFNGSANYYSLLSAISITTDMTVVRAFKRASAGITSIGLATASAGEAHESNWITDNRTYARPWLSGTGSSLASASASTATGSFVDTLLRNGTTTKVRRLGAEIISGATPGLAGNFSTVGRASATYNSGEISFLAVFPTELTGANLTLVEQIAAATNGAVLA